MTLRSSGDRARGLKGSGAFHLGRVTAPACHDAGMRAFLTAVVVVALVVVGVLGMVAGESDDSPGLQGIGGLLIVGGVVLAVRAVRRGRAHP